MIDDKHKYTFMIFMGVECLTAFTCAMRNIVLPTILHLLIHIVAVWFASKLLWIAIRDRDYRRKAGESGVTKFTLLGSALLIDLFAWPNLRGNWFCYGFIGPTVAPFALFLMVISHSTYRMSREDSRYYRED